MAPGTEAQLHEFRIGVVPLLPDAGPFTVTLTLSALGQAPRSFAARPAGQAAYIVSAVPAPPRMGPKRLRLTAEYPGGSLVAEVVDRSILVAGQSLRLSQMRSMRRVGGASLTDLSIVDLSDGRQVRGRVTGLLAVDARVGGIPQVINFSRYPAVRVEDADPPASGMEYQVTVKRGAEVVGQQLGSLLLKTGLGTVDAVPGMNTLGGAAAGNVGPPARNVENGHWYQAVSVSSGLHWSDARERAARMTCQGRRGHLVTLTSVSEAQWVVDHFPEAVKGPYWLGGFQNHAARDYREPDGGWQWVTAEPWSYTRWNRGLYQEPNDASPGHEDFLAFASEGNWNDAREDTGNPGFVVEYD